MIVDTSAMLALIEGATCADALARLLVESSTPVQLSAPAAVECVTVLHGRHGARGRTLFERVRQQFGITITAFTEEHAAAAQRAWAEYGAGSAAELTLNECMAYAVARVAGVPLLCGGPGFVRTDLVFRGDGLLGTWS